MLCRCSDVPMYVREKRALRVTSGADGLMKKSAKCDIWYRWFLPLLSLWVGISQEIVRNSFEEPPLDFLLLFITLLSLFLTLFLYLFLSPLDFLLFFITLLSLFLTFFHSPFPFISFCPLNFRLLFIVLLYLYLTILLSFSLFLFLFFCLSVP